MMITRSSAFAAFLAFVLAAGTAGGLERTVLTERLAIAPRPGPPATPYPRMPDAAVRNVLLYVGDGMGLTHVAATRIHAHGADGRLHMERLPVTGLLATHAADSLITRSDAAATALATGHKTRNGVCGVDPDGRRLPSILEAARDAGLSTGLVTSTLLTDATPASFGAHVASRGEHAAIAAQFLDNRIDVLMGDGKGFFVPRSAAGSGRQDDVDLLSQARERGYAVVESAESLAAAAGDRVLGLFRFPGPSLVARTRKALEILRHNPRGFFLLVEHEGIDEAAHRNRVREVASSVLELDAAVAAGLEYALADGHTLVLVLADHETGGLQVEAQNGDEMQVAWTSKDHTGQPVPLFAFGPHAVRFTGLRDNTDVPRILAAILGLPFSRPGE